MTLGESQVFFVFKSRRQKSTAFLVDLRRFELPTPTMRM